MSSLMEIYMYAWPADHMQDAVSYIYILNNKINEKLLFVKKIRL